MINFDDVDKRNNNHPYIILIIGGCGSGKTNLKNEWPDIDKIYLYAKDSCEAKYQFLINKRESTGLKHLIDSKAFTEYWTDMEDIYKNIEELNPNKKRQILIIFDDMIADMLRNKKLNPIVTEAFIRGRKLNISLAFIKEHQGRKQIEAISNQNERLAALTNKYDHKDDHKDFYKEIFDKIVKNS